MRPILCRTPSHASIDDIFNAQFREKQNTNYRVVSKGCYVSCLSQT